MADIKEYWSKSTERLPQDKDPSSYAIHVSELIPSHAVIADLGGGSGEDATLFATLGHDVTLLDINKIDIEKTKSRAARFGVEASVHAVQHDMSDGLLPLPNDTFDIIYSRLTLHFFDEQTLASLLKEIARTLKHSGKAFLTLKSPEDTEEMAFLRKRAKEISPGVFDMNGMIRTRFTIDQLKSTTVLAGLNPDDVDIHDYVEKLGERTDSVKSNVTQFLLNEVVITKS
jgi:SAM-dependent methyltransferase